jgi:hypothetical protein
MLLPAAEDDAFRPLQGRFHTSCQVCAFQTIASKLLVCSVGRVLAGVLRDLFQIQMTELTRFGC